MPKFHHTKTFWKRIVSFNVNDNTLTPRYTPTYSKKHGMSTQDVVDFHFVATQIFTQCFDLLYKCLLNSNYRMIYTFLLLCGFCLEMFK